MNQEDKQLLLKDLCGRLPYGVKLQKVNEIDTAFELYSIDKESCEIKFYEYKGSSLEICDVARMFRTNGLIRFKPYLRPMSSMTEEEFEELCEYAKSKFIGDSREIDWLNAHHFDYRNLIERGLAIEVTEENNPYKG